MARYRTIKPEFWTSAQVLECSTNARLLFVGIWNFCDDSGRHSASPKQCKASVFPSDDFSSESIRGMLQELSENGLIRFYEVEGKEYFYVTGWHHQRIDKPQPPRFPPPPGTVDDHSENDPGTFSPERSREEGKGVEKKGKEPSSLRSEGGRSRARPPANKNFDRVVRAYNEISEVTGWPECRTLNKARRSQLALRLKEVGGVSGMVSALERASQSKFLCGDNDRGWKADFDFFLQPSRLVKVIEGTYDNRDPKHHGKGNGFAGILAEEFGYGEQSGFQENGSGLTIDGTAVRSSDVGASEPDLLDDTGGAGGADSGPEAGGEGDDRAPHSGDR